MSYKLTLSVDRDVAQKAKSWAKERGLSLSGLVNRYFSTLTEQEDSEFGPWTSAMIGVAANDSHPPPTDEEILNGYVDFLQEKYK